MSFNSRPTRPMQPVRSYDQNNPLLGRPTPRIQDPEESIPPAHDYNDSEPPEGVISSLPPQVLSQENIVSQFRDTRVLIRRVIHTKLVGVTYAENGQNGLVLIKGEGEDSFTGMNPEYRLLVVPDWENVYDSDALAVYLYSQQHQRKIRLGFIGNGERVCTNPSCSREFPRPINARSAVETCPSCNAPTARNGLATRISNYLRQNGLISTAESAEEFVHIEVDWENGGITGRRGGGWRGCNVRLTLLAINE